MTDPRGDQDRQFRDLLRARDPEAWRDFHRRYDALSRAVIAWPKWCFAVHVQHALVEQARAELERAFAAADDQAPLAHYVKRICIRQCVQHIRREAGRYQVVTLKEVQDESAVLERVAWSMPAPGFDPVREVLAQERASWLVALLDKLDAACQELIRRFYLRHQGYPAIAEQLGLHPQTVGARIARCLDDLRRQSINTRL